MDHSCRFPDAERLPEPHALNPGDDISYDGVTYTYRDSSTTDVKPDTKGIR
jgi:hypothetical protein